MAPGRVRLFLQRFQLPTDLAQEIIESRQVCLSGQQATFRSLFAFSVFEDTGGLLDDRAAILGLRVEHRVDLALGDDHVLLAAHTGVAQQFGYVEEATRHTVDRVFRIAVAEEDSANVDLGEIHGQQPRGVVDGQRHLGPAQGLATLRSREDHVVHLLRPNRRWSLRSEHPANGIDHVGLA